MLLLLLLLILLSCYEFSASCIGLGRRRDEVNVCPCIPWFPLQLEAKGDHLKAAHTKTVTKVRKTVDKLEQQLKDKRAENERLERRRRELEESVAMRQSILATRAAGKTGAESSEPNDRLKVCLSWLLVVVDRRPGVPHLPLYASVALTR